MTDDDRHKLIRRLLRRTEEQSQDRCPQPMIEPASVFVERERWQRERRQFFLDTPQVIGFAGEVAEAGSYICRQVLSIPVIISRDEQGVLRAFLNACAHRGARVADTDGCKKRLTCSFHGWSYSLDGELAGRPQDGAFSPEFDCGTHSTRLQALPVSVDSGLIVIGLHAGISQQQVDNALAGIGPALQGLGFEHLSSLETRRYEVAANWKLVTGLSHEGYHFNSLHRDSLAPLMSHHSVFDSYGRHSRWAFPFKGIEALAEQAESDWPQQLPAVINHTIFPGTIIVVTPSDAQIIRAEPGDEPGTSVVYYTGSYADSGTREQSLQAYEFGGDIFEREDLPVAEQCQQGLAAGQPTVIFGRNEPIVQFWHQLWNDSLKDDCEKL